MIDILFFSALISFLVTTGVVYMKKYIDIIRSTRKDWGNVKPYTRIHVSKKYKKPKYKKLEME